MWEDLREHGPLLKDMAEVLKQKESSERTLGDRGGRPQACTEQRSEMPGALMNSATQNAKVESIITVAACER